LYALVNNLLDKNRKSAANKTLVVFIVENYAKIELMIKPLTLGKRTFSTNLIQGPLAGVSCTPFRLLSWRLSQPAFSCTEMISGKTLLNKPSLTQQRFINKNPEEGPVCFQLASSDPNELAEATRRATDFGADVIDLNCGCPVKKIRSKGAGSALLTDPTKLYHMIHAMKQHTHVPVSIKIRVEGNSENKFNHELARVITEAGADFVTVHGRHWTEHYETPCRHEQIQFFVNELKIPVIGNGDVRDLESLKTMFATGCAGVMIGRAGVGQPWLIAKLMAEYQGKDFTIPSNPEIAALFIEHVAGLIALLNNERFAIIQARKLANYYGRSLPNKIAFCNLINTCYTFADLQSICLSHFI